MKTKQFGALTPPKVDITTFNQKRRNLYLEGLDYAKGKNGKEENKEKAFELFSQSASMDYPYAINAIGSFYYKGWVVEQDYEKAFNIYLSAFKKLNPNAAFNLSKMYRHGNFVDQNTTLSKYYFYRALSFSSRELLQGKNIILEGLKEELKCQDNLIEMVIKSYLKKPICEFCHQEIPAKNYLDLIEKRNLYPHLEKKLDHSIVTNEFDKSSPIIENGFCCCACHNAYVAPVKEALTKGLITKEEIEILGKRDDMIEALNTFLRFD